MNMRILETMVSGIPLVAGLRARLKDPSSSERSVGMALCVYVKGSSSLFLSLRIYICTSLRRL